MMIKTKGPIRKLLQLLVFSMLLTILLQTSGCKSVATKSATTKAGQSDKTVPPTVLELGATPGNPRNSEGDFITLKDGRILFIYTHFLDEGPGNNDFGSAYLASRYSTDGGKTWSQKDKIELRVSSAHVMNIMSVSLLRLQNGDIALFYLRKISKEDCIPVMRLSKDETKSWGPEMPCVTDRKGYFTVNNNRIIQLANGRLLLPVALFDLNAPGSVWHKAGAIFVYYSDDNGNSWKSSKEMPNPDHVGTQEPGVAPLKNGQLLLFMRTDAGVQYVSYSKDGGEHWSPGRPGNMASPISPASMVRVPSTGDLLLVWNNNGKNEDRTPQAVALSSDDGRTWKHLKALDNAPKGSYCYTSIHFAGKYVLFGYSSSAMKMGSVIKRVSLKWLYK